MRTRTPQPDLHHTGSTKFAETPLSSTVHKLRPNDSVLLTPVERQPDVDHFYAVLNGISAGLLSFDASLAVLVRNDHFGRLLGIASDALEDIIDVRELLQASSILHEGDAHLVHEACLAAVAGPSAASLNFSGEGRTFTLQVSPISPGRWLAVIEETTARCLAEAEAIQEAMRDKLTGLCTRAMFQDRVSAGLAGLDRDGAGLAMLMIDLDRFKAVNDTLGHPVGDMLLRLVAKRLSSVVRKGDLVARLGGDEFAVMVSPSLDVDGLAVLAKRMLDMLSRPYLVDGHQVNIGASVGLAVAPGDGAEYRQLARNADLALYAAKKSGRGTFNFFEPAMDQRALARRAMEIDLRRALVMREFKLHYQPQIDLERGIVEGFEALVRWQHPERGLVPPSDFIPLAEEIGLIVPLGEWVLREACTEAAGWADDVCVAVNVSPMQFEDPGRLVDMVARALAKSGLPGRRLEVEITESVLLRNEAAVLAALHRIRELGVRVAMDDFGTGYSSLSQLHSFPFDKIKIDRSFVRDGGDAQGQDAIIRAIAALGVSLGMTTIAEGVETADQLARIRAEGCTSVQGYLFSKPVPVGEVAEFIASFSKRAKYP